jgi:5-methylcytosine-specific restriction endonuclease McrA
MSVEAIRRAAEMLAAGDRAAAAGVLAGAFAQLPASTRRAAWTTKRLVQVYRRDSFTDRYFGEPLIYPGALRALSVLAPDLFPYHRNWKQGVTHAAYWSYYPTIDHVVPVARGGADDETNVVTTSMLRNASKANWLLSELGWPAPEARPVQDWDGLLPWFCRTYESSSLLRAHPALKAWYAAGHAA